MSDKRITELELLTELSGEYYLVVDDGVKSKKYNITPIIQDQIKLAGIESGSQANLIEKIKVNGQEARIGTDKSVDISIPISKILKNGAEVTPDEDHFVNLKVMEFVETPTPADITVTDGHGQVYDSGINIKEIKELRTDSDGTTHATIKVSRDADLQKLKNADTAANSRIDTVNTEITDARRGADGTLYSNVGTAIRTQVNTLTDEQASMANDFADMGTDIDEINTSLLTYVNRGYVENGIAYFMHDDEELFQITGIGGGGGGGGGGGNNAVIKVTNNSGWLSKTVGAGAKVNIKIGWSSLEDETPTGDGSLTIRVNNTVKATFDVKQGEVTTDVTNFLEAGSNKIRFTVADVYGNTSSIIFSVQVVNLDLKSSFDPSIIYSAKDYIVFPYTPTASTTKTMHFVVDGTEVAQAIVNVSGRQQTQVLEPLTHGSHTILAYFTADIDGAEVSSNELFYDIAVSDDTSDTPIITSSFRDTNAVQYQTIAIPYKVYTPNDLKSEAKLYANDTLLSTLSVDRTEQIFSYRPDVVGNLVLKIVSGSVSKTFNIVVGDSGIDIEPETNDLALYLTARGRSNSEADPSIWKYNDISAQLTGFGFVSDGWITDENGYTSLRVSGDARVTIPYKAFAKDFRGTGKTIEFEFATRDILNYDSTIMSCMSGGRGFELTAQKAYLKSEQSEILTQYKEDEHIRVSFVVEKRSENRLIYIYTNGIMSGTVQYPTDDDFSQVDPVGITIGSNYCTTDIYNIRVYDNDLSRFQILENWMADTQNIEDLLYRYHHNDVYDEYGQVAIDKLPSDLPYMIINSATLPQYKGDKKTVNGSYTDPLNPDKSFTFSGCQMNVQGTSSAVYARKNYDMQFKGGFMVKGQKVDNYELASGIVPFNRFVLKADVASSEGANNVELVKLFCDITPYKRREQEADPRVRQGIYGFPIVLFWNNLSTNKITFMGKYNFNLPKRAPGPYGYSGNMESWEFQNNTSNLMLFKTDYFDETMVLDPSTGESKEQWRYDYEARFPSDEWTNYAKLQELESFIYSTYRAEATGNALPQAVTYDEVEYTTDTAEYRLAKFKNEFGNYAEINSFIFYYLFTELFLMVDSRAKNLFIGFSGSDTDPTKVTAIDRKAVAEPYDMDTAIGINNEGALAFDYSLEDTDQTSGGANVFNGQDSVLWCNLRDSFPVQIQQMYQTLRSGLILNYDSVEKRFEDHQNKWPEAIFNEDAYFKYLKPLIDDGTGVYLAMLQGSKSEQRKWWLYNRFRYIDSKYNAGDALTDVIQLRGYAKDNITITPYADVYPSVKYGSYLVQERGARGRATTLICPLDQVNDTEIYIYSASQLSSIGDVSGLKVGLVDVSKATKLQNLKIGDSASSYTNGNLKELTLGNNTLLQTLDVRNCPNLVQAVDISGCSNIEYVYFDGTGITGCTLPNGGILKVLHLPETIANLTIRNQPSITEFSMPNYANITTLRLENVSSAVPIDDILAQIPANSRVRLIGFTMTMTTTKEVDDFVKFLNTMRGIDENGNNLDKAVVSGTINGLGTISGSWLNDIKAMYPNLTINYEHLTSNLYYFDYEGTMLYHVEEVIDGGDGVYVETPTPTRMSTQQYDYTFAGWNTKPDQYEADPNATKKVVGDRTVYAAFTRTIRKYTATFIRAAEDGGGTLYVQENVPYGTVPVYAGETPTSTSGDEFTDWDPILAPITKDTTYTASFDIVMREPDLKYLIYTIEGNDMIITGLNTSLIVSDGLKSITIPDTIQGYHVVLG